MTDVPSLHEALQVTRAEQEEIRAKQRAYPIATKAGLTDEDCFAYFGKLKDDVPELEIKREDFFRLMEYSYSLPTGVMMGKRWRRNSFCWTAGAGSEEELDPIEEGDVIGDGAGYIWAVGEYTPGTTLETCNVIWYMPKIIDEPNPSLVSEATAQTPEEKEVESGSCSSDSASGD